MKKDIRENGRIILAWGEVTNHHHEVVIAETGLPPTLAQAQFFELDGVRELIVLEPCVLRHQEHGRIMLDPAEAARGAELIAKGLLAPGEQIPGQYRQGDVMLHPTGLGTWRQIQQREWSGPEQWRQVAD